jgi:hypothetical protein
MEKLDYGSKSKLGWEKRSWKGICIRGGWRIMGVRISWGLLIEVLVRFPPFLFFSPVFLFLSYVVSFYLLSLGEVDRVGHR